MSPELRGLKTTKHLPNPKILIHFHIIVSSFYIPAQLVEAFTENSSEDPPSAHSTLLHKLALASLQVDRVF